MSCLMGVATQLSIGGTTMPFISFQDESITQYTDTGSEAITGFIDSFEERVGTGLKLFGYTVVLEPQIADVDTLNNLIGFTLVSGDGDIGENSAITSFSTVIERGSAVHTLGTCYVDKAVIMHQRGSHPLRVKLSVLATTEAMSGTVGDITFADGGYAFPEVTVTLQGNTHSVDRYALGIDNNLVREFNNSATATCISSGGREIYLAVSTPYSTTNERALYTSGAGNSTGAAASIAYSNGSTTLTYSINNAKLLASPPDIIARDKEVRFDQYYRCYRDDANAALSVATT